MQQGGEKKRENGASEIEFRYSPNKDHLLSHEERNTSKKKRIPMPDTKQPC